MSVPMPTEEEGLTSTLMMAVAPQAEVAICVTCLAEACSSVQIMTFFTRGQLSSPPPSPSLACKPPQYKGNKINKQV